MDWVGKPWKRRRTLIAAVTVELVLVVSACGVDSDATSTSEMQVRPFSEVQNGEFVFEADPTDLGRGIFRVVTTEPMICAIVWGETEALGNLNNSLAMNGTGIVNHDVYLPGAVAGRTYYFQVQGSTADGTLYRSETATFAIPEGETAGPPTDSVDRGVNLALDATVVDVSSEFNSSFAAAYAIDDSGSTEWSSAGDGDEAFITIDLGDTVQIAGVEFVTRSMLDGTAITETFSVTVDDRDTFGPFPAGTSVDPNFAAVASMGRVVRFDVDTSTGGNVGAVEVRVLAAP